MNFEFYESHIKTLADLQRLAEKHNCKLAFGTRNSSLDEEIDESFLTKYLKCPEDVAQEICDKCYIEDVRGDYTNTFFELYDKEKGKYNTLTYFTLDAAFKIIIYDDLDSDGVSGKTRDWILENMSDDYEYGDSEEHPMCRQR
jgi:hypothetical protein